MTWIDQHILTLVTFFPMVAAALICVLPADKPKIIHQIGFVAALFEFFLSLHLYFHFGNTGSFEFMELKSWVSFWNIQYLMGIDGVSLWLVLLTTLLTPIAMAASFTSVSEKVKGFVVSMLLLECGMVGVFCALDMFLFYVFWEVMLVPMYFLI